MSPAAPGLLAPSTAKLTTPNPPRGALATASWAGGMYVLGRIDRTEVGVNVKSMNLGLCAISTSNTSTYGGRDGLILRNPRSRNSSKWHLSASFRQANQFSRWPGTVIQMCTPGISAVCANETDTLPQSVRGTVQNDPSCGSGDVGNNFCCAQNLNKARCRTR